MNDYGCQDDLRNGEQLKVIKENSAMIMVIHQKDYAFSDVGGEGRGVFGT